MKKINKIIIYYDDGTYEEVKNSISDLPSEKDKINVVPNPMMPHPFVQNPFQPPYVVTCTSSNFIPDYKYTITNTSNGNVDLSK